MLTVKRWIVALLTVSILGFSLSVVTSTPAEARSYTVKRHCYWSHGKRYCVYKRHYHRHYYRYRYHQKRPGWNSK